MKAAWILGVVLTAALALPMRAAETVFSGPQAGERTTPFKVLDLVRAGEARERNPVQEHAGAPTVLVFVHTIERSLVPLLRVVDRYGAERKERLKTELVFLVADARAGEQRIRAAAGSLKLQAPVGLSPEGAEGPGNYGLNKECLMTLVLAKDNRVVTNFALVQPGIADAPRVLAALAGLCGDTNPPSLESLTERPMAAGGEGRGGAAMQPGDLARPKEKFPGAVPTDPKLNMLIRQIIRPTNDVATVDRLVRDMEAHAGSSPELRQQAVDAWVRVLHFGDHYGTAQARTAGRELMDRLKQPGGGEKSAK